MRDSSKLLPAAKAVWDINTACEVENISPNQVLDDQDAEIINNIYRFQKCSEEVLDRVTLYILWHGNGEVGLNSSMADLLQLDCCGPKDLALWLGLVAKDQSVEGGEQVVLYGLYLEKIWLVQ